MQETAEQYTSRLRSYLEADDPIDILSATPGLLRDRLRGISDEQLRTRPEPTRWSILEQVVHLSDVEIAVGYRVRSIIGSQDGAPIQAFDQDAWQSALDYNSRSLSDTLDAFEAARKNSVLLYRSLSAAAWNKFGMHSERGKESVRDVVSLAAGHDRNHIRQIDRILSQNVNAVAR